MCGIAGIKCLESGLDLKLVMARMARAMRHRGPDSEGFYLNEANNLALGHRRLSIIDLSDKGCQPLTDASGRYVLAYNGEIYNYAEIGLRLNEYPFIGNSDSEVLLASFAKWGINCLPILKGMFAFTVWDTVDEVLYICRDRLGVKPLYYYQSNEYFLFASEIRSLLESGLIPKRLDAKGLYDFFSFQSTGVPSTIIDGVKQIKPGHYLKASSKGVEEVCYWNIFRLHTNIHTTDESEVRKNIRSLLFSAVKKRMVSDVPVGAFLSGGIDSSAVVALMAESGTGAVNTFTASFNEEEYDESRYAAIIAKKFATNHINVKLTSESFVDELENAFSAMDSPSGDGVNTYVISKAIRKTGIGVALSGVGGDELFSGYPTFVHWTRLMQARPYWKILHPLRVFAGSLFSGSSRFDRIGELLRKNALSINTVYPALRRVLSRRQISLLLPNLPYAISGFESELRDNISEVSMYPLLSQITVAELRGYTLNTLLKDTDQMSMAVSLEIREPFFDHELVEFMLNVPDEFKSPSYPKRLLVESLGDLLPQEVAHRPKQGFVFPWSVWLRGDLRRFATDLILRMCDRKFVDGKALLKLWNGFLKNDRHIRWSDAWLFIVMEYWLEKNGINE